MIVLGILGLGAIVLFLWPTQRDQAGYPFARRVLGQQPSPLWELGRQELLAAMERDSQRLARARDQLERSIEGTRAIEPLLSRDDVEGLSASQRVEVRMAWFSFLEPLLEVDAIKHRYAAWPGVDYVRHPDLHSMAFSLTYAALCAQVNAGQSLLEIVAGNRRVQRLFDEAMPDLGLPSGTFTALRDRLSRARDHAAVVAGHEWFDEWIAPKLSGERLEVRIRDLALVERDKAERWIDIPSMINTARNKTELLGSRAFERWFPVQREVAEWFGDTRIVSQERRLISDAQLHEAQGRLEPGDLLIERRNWYLSNVGLPGFWPHAALYLGSSEELAARFDQDPAILERFGGPFTDYLRREHGEAFEAFAERDSEGHPHRVLEAISEGVVAASFEHSCGADYVAALRPRLTRVQIAEAIERALSYFGRPYDFNFDFATDDAIVCSELVMKAYEGQIDVPFITVAGKRAIPPTEIVRLFARELGLEHPSLEFVFFLDGVEGEDRAVHRDAERLAASAERPKWDLLQP